jgi:hypothetical protein
VHRGAAPTVPVSVTFEYTLALGFTLSPRRAGTRFSRSCAGGEHPASALAVIDHTSLCRGIGKGRIPSRTSWPTRLLHHVDLQRGRHTSRGFGRWGYHRMITGLPYMATGSTRRRLHKGADLHGPVVCFPIKPVPVHYTLRRRGRRLSPPGGGVWRGPPFGYSRHCPIGLMP